jgi:tetratricopeptide (TPR) repeat protein
LTDPSARKLLEEKRQRVLADPESSAAWGELGMAFEAHEAGAEATDCYRRAMALAPDDARWPYLLAGRLNRGGADDEKEESLRLYRLATTLRSPSPAHRTTATLTLAELLTELGRGAEATPLYEQAYAADPNDPRAAYRMGMVLLNRGETEKAAEILLSIVRNPFTRKKSTIAMAELSRRVGRLKDAEGFDTAAGLVPPDNHWANPFTAPLYELRRGRRALMDRYVTQEAAQDDRAALHTATALADQYPSVETQMILLRALVNAGDYPAALAVADDILRDEEGKRLVTAHSFLGLARLGMADRAEAEGRKDDAEKFLTRAVESLGEAVRLKSDYAPGYIYRAKALLRLGKLKDAEADARAAVACRPEEWEGYLALADVLVAAGRKPEAITVTEQAVKLAHPNEPQPKQALEALKK